MIFSTFSYIYNKIDIMKNCKNCGNEIDDNRIYCSYKCRNEYVNRNIRDYSVLRLVKVNNSLEYDKNPKKCKTCGGIISYDNRNNIYCSKRCSATNNNKKRKGEKHNLTPDGYKSLLENNRRQYIMKFGDIQFEYANHPSTCECCNENLPFSKRHQKFCNMDCKKHYYNKNKTEIKLYKDNCKFKFNLKDYPDKFDFDLITKYGWYAAKNHGDNQNGVSRDHIYSIMSGFINNISPDIISHPANCQLIRHKENVSKGKKCDITIEDLLNKIKNWE